MKRMTIWTTLAAALAIALPAPPAAAGVEAAVALERLKALQGSWTGTPEGQGEAVQEAETVTAVVHEFEVSAGGSVVMETMSPGTEHEMINMYHLDGDDLVVTHYCSGGNQPRMRLDREASTADELVFDFDGGTNLDPAVDGHIHSATIRLLGNDKLDSIWQGWADGEPRGEMAFHLSRAD